MSEPIDLFHVGCGVFFDIKDYFALLCCSRKTIYWCKDFTMLKTLNMIMIVRQLDPSLHNYRSEKAALLRIACDINHVQCPQNIDFTNYAEYDIDGYM